MYKRDWLKLKNYPHLNKQMHDKGELIKYISNPINIEKHSFYPLLHYTSRTKKFIREGNKFQFKENKDREIYYAGHIDSQILNYYADKLSLLYENNIFSSTTNYSECVSAYRRVPSKEHLGNKSSIDFANDVFKIIKNKTPTNKVVLTFDITGFFDNLDHKILKQKWCRLLGGKTLPKDHYNIFKTITEFSYVDRNEYYKEFGIKKNIHIKWKKIKNICNSSKEFNTRIREKGLIKSNKLVRDDDGTLVKRTKGIAQGTPISAFLSNLYLMDFDKSLFELTHNKADCIYRRYSDDIIVICNPENADEIKTFIESEISEKYKLKINQKKSEAFIIKNESEDCFSIYKLIDQKGTITTDDFTNKSMVKFFEKNRHPIRYLGFEFFGRNVLIKSSSIAKHYIKLKKTVKRRAFFTLKAKKHKKRFPNSKICTALYKSSLYRRLTHFGQKVKKIGNKKYWGNYLSYALNADKIFGGNNCYRQYRKHIPLIQQEIKKYEKKYKI